MVLEGRAHVYSKIGQMVQEAKNTLVVVTSNYGMIQAFYSGLLNYGFDHPLKDKMHFRFLTSLSQNDNQIEVTKEILNKAKRSSLLFEYNIGDFGAGLFPRFIIKDKNELLFFLRMAEENSYTNSGDTGLWTNNSVLITAFIAFFGEMWSKSRDIFDEIKRREK